MKKLAVAFCIVAVAAVTSASAAEYRAPLFPAPAVVGFDHHEEKAAEAAPEKAVELYKCVKYEDLDHIACCSEVKIIKVLDPCWKPDPCACCQKPKCVHIKICVPKHVECHHHAKPAAPSCAAPAPKCCAPAPKCCDKCHGCGCSHKHEKVTCSANGRYQKYDYGKYRVEIRVKRNGWIVVDYDN